MLNVGKYTIHGSCGFYHAIKREITQNHLTFALFDPPNIGTAETKTSCLKMDGWRMTSPFGMAYVQGRTVSFRKRIGQLNAKPSQDASRKFRLRALVT